MTVGDYSSKTWKASSSQARATNYRRAVMATAGRYQRPWRCLPLMSADGVLEATSVTRLSSPRAIEGMRWAVTPLERHDSDSSHSSRGWV